MSAPKPPACTVEKWLKDNLGPRVLAPLTGTDRRALLAAVQIIELYSEERTLEVLVAFRHVVLTMQERLHFLAYHAIAHVLDWSDRGHIWIAAGLPRLEHVPRCQHEPAPRRIEIVDPREIVAHRLDNRTELSQRDSGAEPYLRNYGGPS